MTTTIQPTAPRDGHELALIKAQTRAYNAFADHACIVARCLIDDYLRGGTYPPPKKDPEEVRRQLIDDTAKMLVEHFGGGDLTAILRRVTELLKGPSFE